MKLGSEAAVQMTGAVWFEPYRRWYNAPDAKKLQEIWGGTYKSQRGMGKGLVAVKKLVDEFNLDTAPGRGTTVSCVFRGER